MVIPTKKMQLGPVSILYFGMEHPWPLQGKILEQKAWQGLPDTQLDLFLSSVEQICKEWPMKNLLVADPSQFNGQILSELDLVTKIETEKFSLLVNRPADGMIIPAGSAMYIGSGDCPTIIAWSSKTGQVVASHAGRDCLFDRGLALGQASSRLPGVAESVVEGIVRILAPDEDASLLGHIHVQVCLGIHPVNFGHSIYDSINGPTNRKIIGYLLGKMNLDHSILYGEVGSCGCLNLPRIICLQFWRLGIPFHQIAYDGTDTFSDRGERGQLLWHSYRRDRTPRRNGILIVNSAPA